MSSEASRKKTASVNSQHEPRQSHLINRGDYRKPPHKIDQTRQSRIKCPPRLIDINRGGCCNVNASVNTLTEVDNLQGPLRITVAHLRAQQPILARYVTRST